jgi:hypothetical protein
MTTTEVSDFVNRDMALCAAALDHGRDVLIRAVEMIRDAERNARQS